MAYGVLENNIVVNAVEATPEFAASQGWKPLSGSAGIGWKFHPGINTFSPPEPPAAPPLPDLAPYQFRAMLKLSGKQDQLYAFIQALPEPERTVAQSKLEYSLVFRRDNELVKAAQQALALSDGEMDVLWQQASEIL